MKRSELKRKTPMKRGAKGLKRGRLKAKSSNGKAKARMAKEFYADCHNVRFADHVPLFHLNATSVVPFRMVDDPELLDRYRHNDCALCDSYQKTSPHHIFAGTKGRSDEHTNLIALCPACHAKVQSDNRWTGYVLYRKWWLDKAHTDWVRLALIRGQALPELLTEAPAKEVLTAF